MSGDRVVDPETGEIVSRPGNVLERLTQAERMLAEIRTVDDANEIVRHAEAARVLAQQMKLGTSAVNHATAIKLRAELQLADLVDEGQSAGTIATHGQPKSIVRTPDNTSPATLDELGVTRQRVAEARKLRAAFTDEEIQQKADEATRADKELSRTKLVKEAAGKQTKARREASRAADPLPDALELRIGDARDVLADIPDASVPLILTDPPYGDKAEPLYRWLAEWSARVLEPGGSLICFTGQSRLNRDLAILDEHLRYWWTLCLPHDQSQRLPGKFVIAEWKPVLWYVNDHRAGRTLVPDVLRNSGRDKTDHDWGQGEAGVSLLIEHLTDPGQLVIDPFAGSALWGRVATGMGRRWIGADIAAGGTTDVVA